MKSIEERAEEYANECWTLDEANFACEDGYIKGATELIDKACEWLHDYFCVQHRGMTEQGFGVFELMFRISMEGE